MSGSGFLDRIKNLIPSSDANARPSYPGEHHAILKLPNGRFGIANYMGPGTNIVKRIKRGDPPRTASDRVAQMHDIEYSLHPQDSRGADTRMVERLNQVQSKGLDSSFNVNLGKIPIKAKMKAEDKGLLNPRKFSPDTNMSDNDRSMLQHKLNDLERQFKPGKRLIGKLKKQASKRKRGMGVVLPGQPPSGGPHRGDGVILPGQKPTRRRKRRCRGQDGEGFSDFIDRVKKMIPSLLRAIGVKPRTFNKAAGKLKGAQIVKYAKDLTNNKDDFIKKIAETISPVAIKSMLIEKGVPGVLLQGQSGAGSGNTKPRHQQQLEAAIIKGLKQASKQNGSGCCQGGTGFWQSLVNVARKIGKVAIPALATAAVTAGTFGTATPFILPAAAAVAAEL
jgi:hypothetical protein